MEQLKDFLGGYNRTWSDLGLVPGFSIICYEEDLINTPLADSDLCSYPIERLDDQDLLIISFEPV